MTSIVAKLTLMAALTFTLAGSVFAETISGKVFEDTNGNGKKDSFEMMLEGRTLMLGSLDNSEALRFGAKTDARGNFAIMNVPTGRYRLRLDSLDQKITTPRSGIFDIVVPSDGPRPYVFGVHDECIRYGALASTFQPTDTPGVFNWDFTFTNTSGAPITDVYFDVNNPVTVMPRDNNLSWNHYAFPNRVGPGQTVMMKLTIYGLAAGDCMKMPLFFLLSDGMCCLTSVDICLPMDQCIGLVDNKIRCTSTGTYVWNLSFQNLTGATVTKVALGGLRNTVGQLLGTPNPSFFNGLAIPDGAVYNLPMISLPALPGETVIYMDIVLYDKNGECCRYTIKTRLPFCEVDGHCEVCPDPVEKLAVKPTFAEARRPQDSPTGPAPASRRWPSFRGTVAARTFNLAFDTSYTRENDRYGLAFIDMESATVASPLLGDYNIGLTYNKQYHGPPDPNDTSGTTDMWKKKYLGSIFGLTMDNRGNTYVAHFGMDPIFNGSLIAGVDPLNGMTPWRFGSILKIDGLTGNISKFAELPNHQEEKPGLGNITFDYDHNLIFAVNMEDGLIYRIPMTGNVSHNWNTGDTYGAFTTEKPGRENGTATPSTRIFAIQYHCGRLYFSRFADTKFPIAASTPEENLIYSIPLDSTGNFVAGLPKYEAGLLSPTSDVSIHSNPVSDISFSPEGRMGVSEMTINYVASAPGPVFQRYSQGAHASRVYEYDCSEREMWEASDRFNVGPASQDSAGGLDYDYNRLTTKGLPYMGRVWFTGTAINPTFAGGPVVTVTGTLASYGAAGFDPSLGVGGHSYYGPLTYDFLPGGVNLPGDTLIIDYNGGGDTSWYSKNRYGDFEIPITR